MLVQPTGHGPLVVTLLAAVVLVATTAVEGVAFEVAGASIIAGSAVALMVRAALRVDDRLTWLLLGSGACLWAAGHATSRWLQYRGEPLPFPSIADVGYLGAVPLLAVAVYRFDSGHGVRRAGTSRVLDSAIVTVAAATGIWILAQPPLGTEDLGLAARLLVTAYPILDIVLIAMAARSLTGVPRSPSVQFVAAGIGCLVVANVGFAMDMADGYHGTASYEMLWPLAFACMAAGGCAREPAARVAGGAREAHVVVVRLRRVVWHMFGAMMVVPLAIAVAVLGGRPVDLVVLGVGLLVLLVLVSIRLGRLVGSLHLAVHARDESAAHLRLAQDRLAQASQLCGRLLEEVGRARELETARLAADLHDGAIHSLAALRREVEAGILGGAAPDTIAEMACDGIGREIDGLRRIIGGLRPPALDERGLPHALGELTTALERRTGIRATVDVELAESVDPEVELVLYRIVQQGLSNVEQHAHAEAVQIELSRRGRQVALSLRDDGRGFDHARLADAPACGHFGLAMMRERVELAGGELLVGGGLGRGTILHVLMPAHAVGCMPDVRFNDHRRDMLSPVSEPVRRGA